MRLHDYGPSGNCFKVRLLLRMAGIPCELVPVDIFAGATLTDAYGRLNPLRETPVLELDDGRTVTQSGAILAFLAEGTRFLPADPVARAQALAWLHLEQERVMAIGGLRFRLLTGRVDPADPVVTAARERGAATVDLLAAHLADRPWLVGAGPTIADLGVFPYVSVAADAGLPPARWPAIAAWLQRVRALEGFLDDYAPYPPNARPGAGRSIY